MCSPIWKISRHAFAMAKYRRLVVGAAVRSSKAEWESVLQIPAAGHGDVGRITKQQRRLPRQGLKGERRCSKS